MLIVYVYRIFVLFPRMNVQMVGMKYDGDVICTYLIFRGNLMGRKCWNGLVES